MKDVFRLETDLEGARRLLILSSAGDWLGFDWDDRSDTCWMSLDDLARLFDSDAETVAKVIFDVFMGGELDASTSCFHRDGVLYHNFKVMIAAGFALPGRLGARLRNEAITLATAPENIGEAIAILSGADRDK